MARPDFRSSPLARRLDPLLSDPSVIARMEALSRRGRPAVEAIGAAMADLEPSLDDTGRQQVGRLVRDAMAERGWRPVRKARVAPGHLFSWGAVYGRAVSGGGGAAVGRKGLERARAILRGSGHDLGTVEDFLAERSRSWGESA